MSHPPYPLAKINYFPNGRPNGLTNGQQFFWYPRTERALRANIIHIFQYCIDITIGTKCAGYCVSYLTNTISEVFLWNVMVFEIFLKHSKYQRRTKIYPREWLTLFLRTLGVFSAEMQMAEDICVLRLLWGLCGPLWSLFTRKLIVATFRAHPEGIKLWKPDMIPRHR